MEIEVLTDGDGTIVAMSARRVIAAHAVTGHLPSTPDAPLVRMVAAAGHTRHLVALGPELATLSLREIAQRYRVVHDGATPRFSERART